MRHCQHCDSAQPQLCAQDNGIFGCGYNSDMTEQAPNSHITAAIWHWNVYYQTAIETAMTCGDPANFVTAMGGAAYYAGLAENFVDTSALNEATAAPNTAAVMDAVRALIVSGEWDVFSGVKLSYDIAEDGTVTVNKTGRPPDDQRRHRDRGRRRPLRGGRRHHRQHELQRGGRRGELKSSRTLRYLTRTHPGQASGRSGCICFSPAPDNRGRKPRSRGISPVSGAAFLYFAANVDLRGGFAMASEYAVEMRGVTKTFGSVVANRNVDLNVRRGEILALLGENGSGQDHPDEHALRHL